MKKNIHQLSSFLKNSYRSAITWFKNKPRKYQYLIVVGSIFVLVVVLKLSIGGTEVSASNTVAVRKVTLATVADLSNIEKDFPLVGTVTSLSEATIRSESSGKLTYVSKKLGDTVYAGGVIGEFENSAERAALLQAEGVYEQAKAARSIAGLNSGQAGTSLTDTKNQSLNTIISAYSTLDDSVRGKTDTAFTDPKFQQVKLLISVPDANLSTSLESKRRTIEKILLNREAKNKTITTQSDLLAELSSVLADAQVIKSYLDDLYTAYSKSLPDANFSQASLDLGKTNTQTARQSISALISSLVTSKTTLSASITANEVAGANNQSESSGAIASADAQVKQALGAYNAAAARLEKTIIRSPITGTLNSLTISTGDYISAFTQVAVVSNNGALEIVSYVNEDDAKRITVGSQATINDTISGVVTRIASAIDPTTRKIEVRIGIKDVKSGLINGQSVSVSILKNKKDTATLAKGAIITIPLSSLKLTPYGANVFTVTSTGTLVALPVKEGAILGEQIQVLQGLTGQEQIVVDARGLKEGMTVETNVK